MLGMPFPPSHPIPLTQTNKQTHSYNTCRHYILERASQTLPQAAAGSLDDDFGRVDGGVPRLGAVDEEAVQEGASRWVGGVFGDGDGAEFGGAAVDVSGGGLLVFSFISFGGGQEMLGGAWELFCGGA